MCGIVGFTRKNWSPEPARIRDAAATIVHRGPDQQGVFDSADVSLGATRLKILDLSGGDQPISTENGDVAIVFNGEIYNHLELRAELESLGHRFRTHCDTETILADFWNGTPPAFARLRGMFAVALWTASAKRLVLARDRVGIKPLYIARRGEDLLFGSELKTILIHPEMERRLNLAALDCYLSLNYVPAPVDAGGRDRDSCRPASSGMARWQSAQRKRTGSCRKLQPRERSFEEAKEELDG